MKFEKGDILHAEDSLNHIGWIIVFKDTTPSYTKYSVMLNRHQELVYNDSCVSGGFKLANAEQKQILFDALAKENKYYCEKTKTIKEMKKEKGTKCTDWVNSSIFTKKDLKSGMWVELRNGDRYLVITDAVCPKGRTQKFILIRDNKFLVAREFINDLTAVGDNSSAFDIIKVSSMGNGYVNSKTYKGEELNIIWERETEEDKQIKEMQNKLSEMKKAYNELEKNISETLDKLNGLKK